MQELLEQRLGKSSEGFVSEYCRRFSLDYLLAIPICIELALNDVAETLKEMGENLDRNVSMIGFSRKIIPPLHFVNVLISQYTYALQNLPFSVYEAKSGNLKDITQIKDLRRLEETRTELAGKEILFGAVSQSTCGHGSYEKLKSLFDGYRPLVNDALRVIENNSEIMKAIKLSYEEQQLQL